MRAANQVVASVLDELRTIAAPGVTTAELDATVEARVREAGATPAFKGYRGFPASLCASINDEVVHGIPSPRKLMAGDIVSLDVGVLLDGYYGDSAVTVAILPEVDEVDVKIDPKELRIDRFCSSGPGGQSVNTTYSAIRITHIPTGEVVSCQDEKSQIKNKAKALKVLRSRLYEKALQEQQSEVAETRRAMVGSGDRSEKIRTYNYPQNRVTDHRAGLSLHRLSAIMEGALDAIIDALIASGRENALRSQKLA